MGSRANFVIVKNQRTEVYYSHWAAMYLDGELFFGAGHAEQFIRAQTPLHDKNISDEFWAEGGAALDFDQRRLTWFGGESARFDISYRRLLLEVMREVWSGWTVNWAHDGAGDIAEAAGIPREHVYREQEIDASELSPMPDAVLPRAHTIVSMVHPDNRLSFCSVRCYSAFDCLTAGPTWIAQIQAFRGVEELTVRMGPDWPASVPPAGLHIDLPSQSIIAWERNDRADRVKRLAPIWKGWRIQWEYDRYEAQLEKCRGLLHIPLPQRDALIAEMRQSLLQEPVAAAPKVMASIKALGSHGHEVTNVNPRILDEVMVPLSAEQRAHIFEWAVASWTTRKG